MHVSFENSRNRERGNVDAVFLSTVQKNCLLLEAMVYREQLGLLVEQLESQKHPDYCSRAGEAGAVGRPPCSCWMGASLHRINNLLTELERTIRDANFTRAKSLQDLRVY